MCARNSLSQCPTQATSRHNFAVYSFSFNIKDFVAEREGFEPPIRLPVCRSSSAVRSTTLPPLRGRGGPKVRDARLSSEGLEVTQGVGSSEERRRVACRW